MIYSEVFQFDIHFIKQEKIIICGRHNDIDIQSWQAQDKATALIQLAVQVECPFEQLGKKPADAQLGEEKALRRGSMFQSCLMRQKRQLSSHQPNHQRSERELV
jgi:hypothetical protein